MRHATAVETGLRIEAGDLDRRELEQGLQRDLEQLVRDEASSASPLVPRHLEVSFRSFELEPGVAVNGKIDRVDGEPMGRAGHRDRLQVGRRHPPPPTSAIRDLLQLPLYMLVLRRQLGLEPVGRRLRPRGRRAEAARHAPRRSDQVPGFSRATTSSPTTSTRPSRKPGRPPSGSSSGSAAGMSGTTRTAATARTGATCGRSCRKARP
jgi:hypothetical protein